jgi:hypothetical protein
MIAAIKNYFNLHPLRSAIFLGLFVRLVATIFSKGFGFFDDHFLVIEAAQSWVDGTDYNNWLPSDTDPTRQPQGHPFFYVGIHYFILKFLTMCGLTDPQGKMYVIRFLHALWSMLIVYYGFKIAFKKSNLKVASWVGIALALYWFTPFLSVRNLVETACIPPMIIATWLAIKNNEKTSNLDAFFIGALLAISFSLRFQTSIFAAGFGLALLLLKTPIKTLLLILVGFVSIVTITQGVGDIYFWKKPFVEFLAYVQYNIDNANNYGVDVWHMYISIVLGLLIPPLSILVFMGYFKNWKKQPILFWPTFLFFAFHTYFPNKQERFILPVIPFIIILGFIGAYQIIVKYNWESKKWLKNVFIFCCTLNFILLPALTFSYSKRNRVEAMCYIASKKDCVRIIVEDSNLDDFTMPPQYYLQNWTSVYGITKKFTPDSMLIHYSKLSLKERPNYVVFMQAEHINERVDSLRKRFPSLKYVTTIEPSFIDKTMHYLNPVNDNQTTYIYSIEK